MLVNDNVFFEVPILRYLFVPAFYVWIMLFAGIYFIYTRNICGKLVFALAFSYLVTLVLGPTVLVRYALPFILTAPVLLAMLSDDQSGKMFTEKTQIV